jgi:hypothetical protein
MGEFLYDFGGDFFHHRLEFTVGRRQSAGAAIGGLPGRLLQLLAEGFQYIVNLIARDLHARFSLPLCIGRARVIL